jgi:hypothetical protein
MAVIIALFGFCDIDIMAQQEIRDVDGIVSSHIVDGMPVFAAIEKEVCQQTFQGGCAFATGSDIIGIWQTMKAVNRIAPYHRRAVPSCRHNQLRNRLQPGQPVAEHYS